QSVPRSPLCQHGAAGVFSHLRDFAKKDTSPMSSETDAVAGPVELEAKFEFDPLRLDLLVQRLNSAYGQVRQRLQLTNIYYDTPDHQLRQAGVALRIRATTLLAEGDGKSEMKSRAPQWIEGEQTVKARGSVTGGLHSRSEWNHCLGQQKISAPAPQLDQPWLQALANEALPGLGHFDWTSIVPLFSTDFERLIWWHED